MSGGPRLTPQEAWRLVQAGGADLVDVREEDEYRAGHVPGARPVPLSSGLPVPGARPLLLICRSGNRSLRAAELLAARGVPVADVAGGMRDWAAAGLPVVNGRGPAGAVA